MPAARTYQFGQKLRGILRIAPPWVLKILDGSPESFFLEIDRLLMPDEVGTIWSGRLAERFPELRRQSLDIPYLGALDVPHPLKAMLAGWSSGSVSHSPQSVCAARFTGGGVELPL